MIKRDAAVGFGRAAAVYESARPSYPAAVVELVDGDVVVDVAAGTGKLTRLLRRDGRLVVGVEPVAAMRAVCAAHAPTLAGTAESIPLRDGSADAVTVAQAFHWFDAERALVEIARVLRPGGLLLMMWNERDDRVPWVAQLSDVIHAHDPGDAYEKRDEWSTTIDPLGLFTAVERHRFDNPHPTTRQGVIDRALSTSYVASASDAVRAQVALDVAAIVEDLDEPFDLPHVVEVFTCRKR